MYLLISIYIQLQIPKIFRLQKIKHWFMCVLFPSIQEQTQAIMEIAPLILSLESLDSISVLSNLFKGAQDDYQRLSENASSDYRFVICLPGDETRQCFNITSRCGKSWLQVVIYKRDTGVSTAERRGREIAQEEKVQGADEINYEMKKEQVR